MWFSRVMEAGGLETATEKALFSAFLLSAPTAMATSYLLPDKPEVTLAIAISGLYAGIHAGSESFARHLYEEFYNLHKKRKQIEE